MELRVSFPPPPENSIESVNLDTPQRFIGLNWSANPSAELAPSNNTQISPEQFAKLERVLFSKLVYEGLSGDDPQLFNQIKIFLSTFLTDESLRNEISSINYGRLDHESIESRNALSDKYYEFVSASSLERGAVNFWITGVNPTDFRRSIGGWMSEVPDKYSQDALGMLYQAGLLISPDQYISRPGILEGVLKNLEMIGLCEALDVCFDQEFKEIVIKLCSQEGPSFKKEALSNYLEPILSAKILKSLKE